MKSILLTLASLLLTTSQLPAEIQGMRFTITAFAVDESIASEIETSSSSDDESYRAMLVKQKTGEAEVVYRMSLIARSGQRAKIQNGIETTYATDFEFDSKSGAWVASKTGKMSTGTEFELDPVLGIDHKTIDLNFALHHNLRPPIDQEVTRRNAAGEEIVIGTTKQLFNEYLVTQITLIAGEASLAGVTTPSTVDSTVDASRRHLIFVRATILGEPAPEEKVAAGDDPFAAPKR